MITDNQRSKLNALIGISYSYKGKNITIEKVNFITSGNIVIHASGRVLCNLFPSEIDDFIEELFEPLDKELKETQIAIGKNELKVFEPTKENTEVKQTLMEVLRKVKNDPSYIPQAESVCNVVGQIVNVQKTEIQRNDFCSSGIY